MSILLTLNRQMFAGNLCYGILSTPEQNKLIDILSLLLTLNISHFLPVMTLNMYLMACTAPRLFFFFKIYSNFLTWSVKTVLFLNAINKLFRVNKSKAKARGHLSREEFYGRGRGGGQLSGGNMFI